MYLSKESQTTLDSYGLEREEPANNKFRGYTGNAHATMSRNCLLARRMIERGVRFVNLYHASWDHHDGLDKDLKYNCSVIDQPIGALLKDLKQRGLLDETLVVCTGEFGRTPTAQAGDGERGRDHHPDGFTVWMAGGGVKGGFRYGATDEYGYHAVEDRMTIHDLHATLLHIMGLDHTQLTFEHAGRDYRLTDVYGEAATKILA